MDLSNKSNEDKIAIVCVGYNRIKSIKRLLGSLLAAQYPSKDIPLIISIDCSGNTELYNYVEDFEWPHGEKHVLIQETRLGLINHIFKCGDLTRYFKGIVLLEDDIYVSPFFYNYVVNSLEKYGNDSRIAQISLYTNETNGYVGLPLCHIMNNNDTFLMQDVSTWGECWNYKMWSSFKIWMESHNDEYIQQLDMPIIIKKWSKAWSKYYNAYVVDTCKYVLYPNISVTTNFSDAGVHGGDNNSLVQVNLLDGPMNYRFNSFEDLVKYDIYYNNISIYDWLGLDESEVNLDLYGFHPNDKSKRYILSTKTLPYSIVKSFALNMRPIELNIKYNIIGKGIYLYDTMGSCDHKYPSKYPLDIIEYYLQGFSYKMLLQSTISYYWSRIKARIRI